MSDLLQQAIIDAAALKEAAIKNAENTLVEKYSQEFKQTVEKLLEQEDAAAAPADPAAAAPPPTDPAAATAAAPAATPTADASATGQTTKRDAFKSVKTAFLDGPDDELITINFDQIKKTMMEMMGHVDEEYDRSESKSDVSDDALKAGAPKKNKEELEESADEEQQEYELEEDATYSETEGVEALEEIQLVEEEELSTDTADTEDQEAKKAEQKAKVDAANAKVQGKQKELEATKKELELAQQQSVAESIELSEEELLELAEEVRVDLKPESQGRGYMGSTTVEKERLRDVEFAAARDEAATKAREDEKKRMQDLVKENAKLQQTNKKMMSMFETLKVQVEKINVSNAKLLYTNKALGNISLNERQKNQIVESISKADSVLEAKTIYETLQNAVENASVKTEAPQSLRETLNRAQSPFVVKKTASNSMSDFMAERMKALAGIKKNK